MMIINTVNDVEQIHFFSFYLPEPANKQNKTKSTTLFVFFYLYLI